MKKLDENQKVTLTIGQLKKLVKETIYLPPPPEDDYPKIKGGPAMWSVPQKGLLMQEDESVIQLSTTEITQDKVRMAEQILINNGIEEDEADAVLQALGYVLLDTELYPEIALDEGIENGDPNRPDIAWTHNPEDLTPKE